MTFDEGDRWGRAAARSDKGEGMGNTTLLIVGIGVIILVCIPIAGLVKQVAPNFVERAAGIERIQSSIYVLQSEISQQEHIVQRLSGQRSQLQTERNRLNDAIRKLNRKQSETRDVSPLFIHELGEPGTETRMFTMRVERERQSYERGRRSGERVLTSPIWEHGNIAEVWATDLEEARRLADTAFPFKMGYRVILTMQSDDSLGISVEERGAA